MSDKKVYRGKKAQEHRLLRGDGAVRVNDDR